jgi:queuine/archaeosine tRNA-ribosyltransferase
MSEACDRTIRWIERNDNANKNKDRQTLFPIM